MNKYLTKEEALPIEWMLYDKICPVLAPIAYEKFHLTPNMITLIGGVMSILALNALKNNNLTMFTTFLIIRQILDGLDGYVARKYKHFSKWGEILDHGIDEITIFSVCLLIYRFLGFKKFMVFACFAIVLSYFQDKRLKCLVKKDRECLKKTKIFSCFESVIFMCFFIIMLFYIK